MRKLLAFFLIILVRIGYPQIVDDTTELVYGPKTTKYFYIKQVLNDDVNYVTLDTSLYLFERQSFVDRSERKYQNLGSFGTALFPVFYDPQQVIGRTSGFNAYRPFFRNTKQIRFYDTKSPFINLFSYLGGGNQNMTNIDFSRNVRKGWNIGFDFHNITTDKQLANDGEADRQVVGTSYDIYTHYTHQKIPYQALFYYSNMSHKVIELGGVRYQADSTLEELFEFNNALLRLIDAQNVIRRNQYYLYHDYQVADQFQLYHVLSLENEENAYDDFSDGATTTEEYNTYSDAYNGVFLINPDTTIERAKFSSFSNEVGIKGDLSGLFYRAFLRFRNLDFKYLLLDSLSPVSETYLGGYIRFNWKDQFKIIGEMELMESGAYKFKGQLNSDLIGVTYQSLKYHVPLMYNNYYGNHYEWDNDFSPGFVNQISGSLRMKYNFLTLIPKINFTAYNNYIYFNESKMPSQAVGGIAITSIGGEISFGLENQKGEGVYIENEVFVTNVSGGAADVVRIPDIFYNGRYYWRGLLFDDKVPIEAGLDTHARTAYFANGYEAVTQQFYLQNELEISGYYKADLFFNMRLDKFFMAIKWQYINQPSNGGYFATPYFPGQPSVLDLMIKWTFFD